MEEFPMSIPAKHCQPGEVLPAVCSCMDVTRIATGGNAGPKIQNDDQESVAWCKCRDIRQATRLLTMIRNAEHLVLFSLSALSVVQR